MTATTAPTVILVHRTWQAAEKAGNTYTVRPECTACGYRGKWTQELHAQDLADAHKCGR